MLGYMTAIMAKETLKVGLALILLVAGLCAVQAAPRERLESEWAKNYFIIMWLENTKCRLNIACILNRSVLRPKTHGVTARSLVKYTNLSIHR